MMGRPGADYARMGTNVRIGASSPRDAFGRRKAGVPDMDETGAPSRKPCRLMGLEPALDLLLLCWGYWVG